MIVRVISVCCLLAALAACAPASEPVGSEIIDSRYATGGGRFDDGSPIFAVARVHERGGRTVLCAAWTVGRTTAAAKPYIRDASAGIRFSIAGERLAHGVSGFPALAYSGNLSGQSANCVVTNLSWRSEFASAGVTIEADTFKVRYSGRETLEFGGADLPSIVR